MKKMFRYALLGLWLGSSILPLAAQSPSQVKEVQLQQVGPQSVSEPLIRANIRVKAGDQFSRVAVDDDVRNLYNTGYFYNIRVTEEQTPEGVILGYVLVAKPRVTEIKYVGNTKYDNKDLQKLVKSKVGEPLDERKLFLDVQEIKKKYVNAGFPRTEVRNPPIINLDENAGRASVTFEITETPKVRLVDVVFDGAKAFKEKKLRKVIKTRRWWMFSWITQSGRIKDEDLDEDKDKIADYYREKGYIDFELRDVKQEFLTPTRVILHFIIHEGRQYKVGAISFKGVKVFNTNDILKTMQMKVGENFTPTGLSKDLEAIEDFYGTKGYIGSTPRGSVDVFARKNPNIETGTMDLVYEINEGEKSTVERIEIKGNVRTKDRVIRRELAVSPGETFDMVRVKRSKGRLQQMGFFNRVDARPETTDVPNRKDLIVGVEERETGQFTIGAGFSSVDSLVGFIELKQSNFDLFNPPTFTGAGQKFRLHASVGTVRQDYQVSFEEPWFLDRKLRFMVDLYYRELGFYSDLYDQRNAGARFTLERALGSDFLRGSVSYTLESIGIINVNRNSPLTILDAEGDHLLNRFGAGLTYDTSNAGNFGFLPDGGHRSELTGEVVLGEANFYKLEAKTTWFFPGFAEGHVLEVGLKAGVVEALSSFGTDAGPYRFYHTTNRITGASRRHKVKNLAHNDVPFFERYFLGGAYSLRGFRYRDVSPQERGLFNIGLEPVGGNTFYLAYAEYSVPIIVQRGINEVGLRLAAFYDMGNVFYRSYQFEADKFNADVGLGVRLNIPQLGPLRFDYGIPVHDSNDLGGGGRFNFTVGYRRDF
ncbi:MAG TPA: outer membrane protein assembly factor BamA [Methylomirabilota bacterium]|nr:outer membrane protein assembly factor BamA [Methylomirabilota bacterium]